MSFEKDKIRFIESLTDDEKHNFEDLTELDQLQLVDEMYPFSVKVNVLTIDSGCGIGDDEFGCYLCKRIFSSKNHLRQHIKGHLRRAAIEMILEEKELCPICKIREVEVDDLGYYGCRKCMPELSQDTKAKIFDQDGTGQDEEVYD